VSRRPLVQAQELGGVEGSGRLDVRLLKKSALTLDYILSGLREVAKEPQGECETA
jgi:hypothetical protein